MNRAQSQQTSREDSVFQINLDKGLFKKGRCLKEEIFHRRKTSGSLIFDAL